MKSFPDTPLFVRDSGEGRPLLLVHGLMATGETFMPVMEALAGRYTVIVPDLRGHGRSSHLGGSLTVEHHVRDLTGLLDHIGVEQADVLGYSQGGAVTQSLARDYPDRVRRLVLVNTFAHNRLTRRERLEDHVALWTLRLLGPRTFARIAVRPGVGGGGPLTPAQTRRLREMIASGDRKSSIEAIRAMTSFDSRPWLREIACPTLVIHSSEDTAVPRHHAVMLANGIPNAEFAVIEGAGHALVWTHPQELIEEVEHWLDDSAVQNTGSVQRRKLWRN